MIDDTNIALKGLFSSDNVTLKQVLVTVRLLIFQRII